LAEVNEVIFDPFTVNQKSILGKSSVGNPNPMSVLVQSDSMMVIGTGDRRNFGKRDTMGKVEGEE
jgi:hypothetical protein